MKFLLLNIAATVMFCLDLLNLSYTLQNLQYDPIVWWHAIFRVLNMIALGFVWGHYRLAVLAYLALALTNMSILYFAVWSAGAGITEIHELIWLPPTIMLILGALHWRWLKPVRKKSG